MQQVLKGWGGGGGNKIKSSAKECHILMNWDKRCIGGSASFVSLLLF